MKELKLTGLSVGGCPSSAELQGVPWRKSRSSVIGKHLGDLYEADGQIIGGDRLL